MEVNAAGYYVIPRYLGWEEFLIHTRDVLACGNKMLVRVQEIARGVLFFVFQDNDEKKRYYYARRTTKLRIVTNLDTLKKEYLLDHVKAMHID